MLPTGISTRMGRYKIERGGEGGLSNTVLDPF